MPLPRHKVAAYHRARRARLKAERRRTPHRLRPYRSAAPSQLKNAATMLKWSGSSATAGGRNGTMRKADGATPRYAPPRSPRSEPRTSMVAIGGKPGTGRPIPGYDPTFAPHDGYAVSHQVNTVIMLSALAARADELERRIAALEAAAANRKAETLDLAQMIFGLARCGLYRRTIGQAGQASVRIARAPHEAARLRSRPSPARRAQDASFHPALARNPRRRNARPRQGETASLDRRAERLDRIPRE